MDKILIVDASPLIYAVWDTQGHLATTKGQLTGLRYGFLRSVRSYQERTKSDKVVICFDVKGPIKKAEGIQSYKSNRVFTDDKAKMYSQVPGLREMLSMTKWTQIDAPGYEADDLIGAVVRAKAPRGHEIAIITTDNDMAQLVTDNVKIFMPGKKGKKDFSKDDLAIKAEWSVWPEHLLLWRSIVGDKSDNIEAAVVLGKDLQTDMLSSLEKFRARGVLLAPSHLMQISPMFKQLADNPNVFPKICSNYNLMSLVTPTEMSITKGRKDVEGLTNLFMELEFKSMISKIDELCGTNEPTV